MACPTDRNTISLIATSLSALHPESLSGEQRLNTLRTRILNGINLGVSLDLTTTVASDITTTLHKDASLDWLVAENRQFPGDDTWLDTPIDQFVSDAFNKRLRMVRLQTFLSRMTVVPYGLLDEATWKASSWPCWKTARALQSRYWQAVRLRPGHRQVQCGGHAGYQECVDDAGER